MAINDFDYSGDALASPVAVTRVAVLGAGYVGIVQAAGLARLGHAVVCADVNADKIAALGRGEIPIHEPGLPELVHAGIEDGRLRFTVDPVVACRNAKVIFCCVGTPTVDGTADLSYVFDAARMAARAASDGRDRVFVLKSTVPAGTNAKVQAFVPTNVAVANNPEFLAEGTAVNDFFHCDRIVIGARSSETIGALVNLYAPITTRVFTMSPESAELTKYAANSMLATRISFANELAALCEKVGADYEDVRAGYGADARIGGAFLRAGVGFGGSCFGKDVQALLHTAGEHSTTLSIVHATMKANERARRRMAERVVATVGENGSLRGRKIAIWGVAFKADTDDTRDSTALTLADHFAELGAEVVAYDPVAKSRLTHAASALDAVVGAAALVVVTDWMEFSSVAWGDVTSRMDGRDVFDGRNFLRQGVIIEAGLKYHGVGRAP